MRPNLDLAFLMGVVFMGILQGTLADSLGRKFQVLLTGHGSTIHAPSNLTDLLTTKVRADPETFRQAKLFIDNIQRSSSCHRVAAQDLLESCRSPDPVETDDRNVQQLKSLYGARLAICETQEAGLIPPSECSGLLITENVRDGRVHSTNAHAGDLHNLPRCLSVLEKRTQTWTSYSNNRQQATILCQAARAHVEQAQLLSLHKHLVDVQEDISDALAQQLRQAAVQSAEHEDFLEATRQLQDTLFHELESYLATTKEHLVSIRKEYEEGFHSTTDEITTEMEYINVRLNHIDQTIDSISTKATGIQHQWNQTVADIVTARAELAAYEVQHMETSRTTALETQQIAMTIQEKVLEQLHEISNELHVINKEVADIRSQNSGFQEDMAMLQNDLEVYKADITNLHNAQLAITNEQLEASRNALNVTRMFVSLLQDASFNLANLIIDVEKVKDALASIQNFAGPLQQATVFFTQLSILIVLWHLRYFSLELSFSCIAIFVTFSFLGSLSRKYIPDGKLPGRKAAMTLEQKMEHTWFYVFCCLGFVILIPAFIIWKVRRNRQTAILPTLEDEE